MLYLDVLRTLHLWPHSRRAPRSPFLHSILSSLVIFALVRPAHYRDRVDMFPPIHPYVCGLFLGLYSVVTRYFFTTDSYLHPKPFLHPVPFSLHYGEGCNVRLTWILSLFCLYNRFLRLLISPSVLFLSILPFFFSVRGFSDRTFVHPSTFISLFRPRNWSAFFTFNTVIFWMSFFLRKHQNQCLCPLLCIGIETLFSYFIICFNRYHWCHCFFMHRWSFRLLMFSFFIPFLFPEKNMHDVHMLCTVSRGRNPGGSHMKHALSNYLDQNERFGYIFCYQKVIKNGSTDIQTSHAKINVKVQSMRSRPGLLRP